MKHSLFERDVVIDGRKATVLVRVGGMRREQISVPHGPGKSTKHLRPAAGRVPQIRDLTQNMGQLL